MKLESGEAGTVKALEKSKSGWHELSDAERADCAALFEKVKDRALRIEDNNVAVELRRSLRSRGPRMTSYILEQIGEMRKRNDPHFRYNAYILTHALRYTAVPEDSVALGELLLSPEIAGNPDRSAKHAILEILKRVGTAANIPQFMEYLDKCSAVTYRNGSWATDAVNVAEVMLYIGKRLDSKDAPLIDQAIEEINQKLRNSGHAPVSASQIEIYEIRAAADVLDKRWEAEFETIPEPPDDDDYESYDDLDFGYTTPGSNLENDRYDPWDTIREEPSRRPSAGSREHVSDDETQKRIDRVNELTLKEGVAPTAVPAIQLHIFNFLTRKPDANEEEIRKELAKLEKLSEIEKEYADPKNPLPTVGVEIETLIENFTTDRIDVLNAFHIVNYDEPGTNHLYEVNTAFSYSARVQSRVLQELAALGVMPLDSRSGKIDPSEESISMHLNFGMPEGISPSVLDRHGDDIMLLSDAFTYAFTSPKRLLERKTSTSVEWNKEANRSGKSGTYTSEIRRIEFRALEFKDYPTYRLLAESQRLVAMLVSSIKFESYMKCTYAEACLADLWSVFRKEMKSYFASERLQLSDVDNYYKKESIAEKLRTTDLARRSRFLVSDFSRRVARILEEKPDIPGEIKD